MFSENRLTRVASVAFAVAVAIFCFFAFTAQASAVSGPSTSPKAPGYIYIGYTHIGDGLYLYKGSSGKATVSKGRFKYTKSNNTLTLNNIGNGEDYYLDIGDMGDNFKIKLVGKNSLGCISIGSNAKDRMNLIITGTGSLRVNSEGSYGAAIHGYAYGKSNNKVTIDNTVNAKLYGGTNIFTGRKETVILVEGAKSSNKADVFRIGGKKTGSTKVKRIKTKKGYNYYYGGYKLTISKSGSSMPKSGASSEKKKANTPVSIKNKVQINLSETSFTYNGKARKPSFSIYMPKANATGLVMLQQGVDYTYSYKNNIEPGTASLIVKGKGRYTGTATRTFKITKLQQPAKLEADGKTVTYESIGKACRIRYANKKEAAKVTYSSSNAKVATVNNGIVTIKGTGTAIIYVKFAATKHYRARTLKYKINVLAKQTITTKIKDGSKIKYTAGKVSLGASLSKGNGKLSYKSSDTSVVSVDSSGNLVFGKASKLGTAAITITAAKTGSFAKAVKTIKVTSIKGTPTLKYTAVQEHNHDESPFSLGVTPTEPVALSMSSGNPKIVSIENDLIKINQNNITGDVSVDVTVVSKETKFYNASKPAVITLKILCNTTTTPLDLSAGRWYALTYPDHASSTGSESNIQKFATDWNLPGDADAGLAVYAMADGVVEYVSIADGSIRIRHTRKLALTNGFAYQPEHWRTWYGHMNNITVNVGSVVTKGQVVGVVGNRISNGSVPNHLHFSVYGDRNDSVLTSYQDICNISDPISPYWIPGLNNADLYCDNENGDRDPEWLYEMILDTSLMPGN